MWRGFTLEQFMLQVFLCAEGLHMINLCGRCVNVVRVYT